MPPNPPPLPVSALEKYRDAETGLFKDTEGCHYGDAGDLILGGMLQLCGCGQPEDALHYIHEMLERVDAGTARDPDATGADYFFWYVMDRKDFMAHGGTVPGWLTKTGTELLACLREWKQEQEEHHD